MKKWMIVMIALLAFLIPTGAHASESREGYTDLTAKYDIGIQFDRDTVQSYEGAGFHGYLKVSLTGDYEELMTDDYSFQSWRIDVGNAESTNPKEPVDDFLDRIESIVFDGTSGSKSISFSAEYGAEFSLSGISLINDDHKIVVHLNNDLKFTVLQPKMSFGAYYSYSNVKTGQYNTVNIECWGTSKKLTGKLRFNTIESSNPDAKVYVDPTVDVFRGEGSFQIYSDLPTIITLKDLEVLDEDSISIDYVISEPYDSVSIEVKAANPSTRYYNVTFDNNGHGTKLPTQTVPAGKSIVLPTMTDKEGYELVKWSEGSTMYAPGTYVNVTRNMNFKAIWQHPDDKPSTEGKVSISFDNAGIGNKPSDFYVEKGTSIPLPDLGTVGGYTFTGWSDGQKTYAPGAYTVVNKDTTFRALWQNTTQTKTVIVSFDNGGRGTKPIDREVQINTSIILPDLGKVGDYILTGWSDGQRVYAPGSYAVINRATTFRAQWQKVAPEQQKVIVSFDNSGHGSKPADREVPVNTTIILPDLGTVGNYTFTGWSDGRQVYAPGAQMVVNQAKTLYAQWQENTQTKNVVLSFNNNGRGSKPADREVPVNTSIVLPDLGTVGDYTFAGWADGSTLYSPGASYTVTQNKTLYARWEKMNQTYTVSFVNTGDVEQPSSQTVKTGDSIRLPKLSNDGKYIFKGWSDGVNSYQAYDDVVINKDMTFIAQWELQASTRPTNILMYIDQAYMTVDVSYVPIDAAPYIRNDRTYVPIRALSEGFGAEVYWENSNRSIRIELDGKTVLMYAESTTYWVDGVRYTMDVAPEISNTGRTFVPIRFVAEALGFAVYPSYNYDGTTASVFFSYL